MTIRRGYTGHDKKVTSEWFRLFFLFRFGISPRCLLTAEAELEVAIASLSLAHLDDGMPALSLRLSSFLRRPTDGSESILDSDEQGCPSGVLVGL